MNRRYVISFIMGVISIVATFLWIRFLVVYLLIPLVKFLNKQ